MNVALENQSKIDEIKIKALNQVVEKKGLEQTKVYSIIGKFGYKAIADIMNVDYMNIYNAIKEA